MTLHVGFKPAAVSTVLGSLAVPLTLIGVPSGPCAGALVIVAVGATLVTVMVLLSVPIPWSLSSAVSDTAYVPLSFGVKLKLAPLPVANGLPFFVTLHVPVNPADVSTALGSVTVLPRLIAAPSGLLAG